MGLRQESYLRPYPLDPILKKVDHGPTKFCMLSSWIEGIPGVSDAGNATIESGERHGYGDNDDAGSEKYLLLLNNKGIYSEGLFLNFDWSRSGVPVAA